MSIRIKLMLLIVGAIICNLLLLFCYSKEFVAESFLGDFNALEAKLDTETMAIADKISNDPNYSDYLKSYCKKNNLVYRLEDMEGNAIYQSKPPKMEFLYINSVKPVKFLKNTYLLKISRPLLEDDLIKLPSVRSVFNAEIFIAIAILLLLSLIIYLRFVRPIEDLQKAVAGYKHGYTINHTRRTDELGKLQNSFVTLTEDLKEEKNKQNRIIASISHDIKTPLTSVMGYAERFKKGNLSEERAARYIDTIYLKSLAIKDLIEEFDDYLSYNYKSALKKQEITVGELMKIVSVDYEDELTQMGVRLKISNSCPDHEVEVDISKLRRVFGNIISNSLKHFSGSEKNINIVCAKNKQKVLFYVADNGEGVQEDLLLQIFEPMYTSDEGRSVAGLGLAICREIINNHGGEIWAENNDEGGLTITFDLPVKQPNK